MKKYLILILTLFFCETSFSQIQDTLNSIGTQIQSFYKEDPKNVSAAADSAIKLFTWDIQKEDKGSLMFLDVAYQRQNIDTVEYVTLTVAKGKTETRPVFISVIVPNNVDYTKGIYIQFSKTVKEENGEWKTEMSKNRPLPIHFEKRNPSKDYFSARIIDGYVIDEKTNKQIDVFQEFMNFDNAYVQFFYADGSTKSVAIPLFSFKTQYETL